jgi:hypothetical protein
VVLIFFGQKDKFVYMILSLFVRCLFDFTLFQDQRFDRFGRDIGNKNRYTLVHTYYNTIPAEVHISLLDRWY